MDFRELSQFLNLLEKTASRLEMTRILAEVFKKSTVAEIDKICYLVLGRLAPKYLGIELMLAEKMMIRVLATALQVTPTIIAKTYKEMGDLGEVAFKIKKQKLKIKNAHQNLQINVKEVYQKLVEIAQESGEGSQERKINKMAELLRNIDPLSAKYLVRISLQKLRLGFSDMTVLDALSWSQTGNKSLRQPLEAAFNVLADIGKIASIFKKEGLKGIRKIKSEVGIPILPAKAERLKNPEEILEKMGGRCALEPKYDGLRCEVHLDKKRKFSPQEETSLNLFDSQKQYFVRIFSRNLDNLTSMFPDIVKEAQKLPVESVILDGEAIAYHPKTGQFLPFQETIQRKRKHGVRAKAAALPLKVFCFDILNYQNRSLLNLPFQERRKILTEIFQKSQTKNIVLTEQKIVDKAEDFEKFFQEVVSEGLEGLMAKKLEAGYQAGARNYNWVKYKAGMKSELADTIDCVVMGYYKGRGKRASFGIGAFLVGIPDKNKILTVSKIGTGLTDKQWQEMYQRCEKLKINQKPKEYFVHKNLFPDVWCRSSLVVEIEADNITYSPIHTAGLALRFPRLKRFRDDKKPYEATSLKELQSLKSNDSNH